MDARVGRQAVSDLPGETGQAGLAADDFDRLLRDYYPRLLAYLGRRLGRDLAEDIAEDTFVIALRSLQKYDPSRGSELAWLFAIANGLLAHHRRTERRRLRAVAKLRSMQAVSHVSGDAYFAGAVERRLTAQAELQAASRSLLRMPSSQRDAIYLVAIGGLSYEEAALVLDVPAGTVRSRAARARSRLRNELNRGLLGSNEQGGRDSAE